MDKQKFNRAKEIEASIEEIQQVLTHINNVGDNNYKLAIQIGKGRRVIPINEPIINCKIKEYLNQRMNELEEEFTSL